MEIKISSKSCLRTKSELLSESPTITHSGLVHSRSDKKSFCALGDSDRITQNRTASSSSSSSSSSSAAAAAAAAVQCNCYNTVTQTLLRNHIIVSVSSSSVPLVDPWSWTSCWQTNNQQLTMNCHLAHLNAFDFHFLALKSGCQYKCRRGLKLISA